MLYLCGGTTRQEDNRKKTAQAGPMRRKREMKTGGGNHKKVSDDKIKIFIFLFFSILVVDTFNNLTLRSNSRIPARNVDFQYTRRRYV